MCIGAVVLIDVFACACALLNEWHRLAQDDQSGHLALVVESEAKVAEITVRPSEPGGLHCVP